MWQMPQQCCYLTHTHTHTTLFVFVSYCRCPFHIYRRGAKDILEYIFRQLVTFKKLNQEGGATGRLADSDTGALSGADATGGSGGDGGMPTGGAGTGAGAGAGSFSDSKG